MSTDECSTSPHIEWASKIKAHHHHLHQNWLQKESSCPCDSDGKASFSEDIQRWKDALGTPCESASRVEYAEAMYFLATRYWNPETDKLKLQEPHPPCKRSADGGEAIKTTGGGSSSVAQHSNSDLQRKHYDDRIQYCLDCISSYFIGTLKQGNSGGEGELTSAYATLPLSLSRAIKPLRRAFFEKHQRMATPLEIDVMINEVLGNATAHSGMAAVGKLLHLSHSSHAMAPVSPPLHILDVGSCYGPFSGKALPHSRIGVVPLHVTSVDLEPAKVACSTSETKEDKGETAKCNTGTVLRGDWLSISFFDFLWPPQDECFERVHLSKLDGHDAVASVAVGSLDAVLFCLLLSYLPSPRLRFLACLNAFLALKEGGLLVIVSTRTQGARKSNWHEQWVHSLETIGFSRVHQNIRGKIVGISLEKRGDAVDVSCHEKRQEWINRMMCTKEANNGLRITADDVF